MDPAETARQLYALPPAEFTAARTGFAKQARSAGDRALATRIQSMRKPTVAAWAVNQLARQQADAVSLLLDLGEELRAGMSGLAGEELRELTQRRYRLVTALVDQTRTIAAAAEQRFSDEVATAVRATLEATLADPASADAVRSGCLAAALQPSGFGFGAPQSPPDISDSGATDEETPVGDLGARRKRRDEEIARAQAVVDAATEAEIEARDAATEAAHHVELAERRQAKVRAKVARLETKLDRAKEDLDRLDIETGQAREARAGADERYEDAAEAKASAQGRLGQLTR